MSFIHMLFASREDRRVDDPAVRRALELWKANGAIPVAHIVADLGAFGEATAEYETAPVPPPRRWLPAS
jgi:hypothetical protein